MWSILGVTAPRTVASNRAEGPVSTQHPGASGVACTSRESESESLALQATAEAEVSRTGVRLAFPPALEARYKSDTATDRARDLRTITHLGALLYPVAGVALKILLADPLARLIPALLMIDTCPLATADRADSFGIVDEKTPGALTGIEDLLVRIPNKSAKLVLSKIGPDVLHWVQLG